MLDGRPSLLVFEKVLAASRMQAYPGSIERKRERGNEGVIVRERYGKTLPQTFPQ